LNLDGILAIAEIFQNLISYGDKESTEFFKASLLKAKIENTPKEIQILEYIMEACRTLKNATDIMVEHSLHEIG